jgi:hypothetical protein
LTSTPDEASTTKAQGIQYSLLEYTKLLSELLVVAYAKKHADRAQRLETT